MCLSRIACYLISKLWASQAITRDASSPRRALSPASVTRSSALSVSSCLRRPVSISAGSTVLYKAHRDWGLGIVEWELNGRVCASFETPDGPYTDEFAEAELELAQKVTA